MVARAIQATRQLAEQNIRVRVVEMHTIKPLDTELVVRCARETGAIVTAEEHSILGGLGGAVSECLSEFCPIPLERVGVHDTFTECGPYSDLLDKYGMSIESIVAATQQAVSRKADSTTLKSFEVSKR